MPTKVRKIIAVAGGKGGVGKSLIAANLAIALAEAGQKVVLADLDLGMANQHTLFGVDKPGPTLQAFITRQIETLEPAVLSTSNDNLHLLPGSGAHMGAANINYAQKQRIIRALRALDTDVLVLDVGAGMNYNALDFFLMADLRVLVMTPQLTSLENAYAFLKVALYRSFRNVAKSQAERHHFDVEQNGRELDAVHKLVKRLAETDPIYAAAVEKVRKDFGLCIVGNLLQSSHDANSVHSMRRMIGHFLALESRILGTFQSTKRLHNSVSRRHPFMFERLDDGSTASFRAMARALLAIDVTSSRSAAVPLDVDEQVHDGLDITETKTDLPAALAHYERRQPRMAVSVPVNVTFEGVVSGAMLAEISLNGALLVGLVDVAVNDRIEIADMQGEFRVKAVVRTRREHGDGVGVEFDVPQEALVEKLTGPQLPKKRVID